MQPDRREIIGMDTFEREAQIRLNPFGSARPPYSQDPDSPNRRRGLWRRLRDFFSRGRTRDDEPGPV